MSLVVLEEYNPQWKELYRIEKEKLINMLSDELINIFHIGSTSIENMIAKPTVDIMIVVKNIENIDNYQEKFEQLGYIGYGENGIPGRRYFAKYSGEQHLYHIHIFQYGDLQITKHLNFKRYLSEHQEAFSEYQKIKQEGCRLYSHHREQYQEYKAKFIEEIDKKAEKEYKNI